MEEKIEMQIQKKRLTAKVLERMKKSKKYVKSCARILAQPFKIIESTINVSTRILKTSSKAIILLSVAYLVYRTGIIQEINLKSLITRLNGSKTLKGSEYDLPFDLPKFDLPEDFPIKVEIKEDASVSETIKKLLKQAKKINQIRKIFNGDQSNQPNLSKEFDLKSKQDNFELDFDDFESIRDEWE